MAENLTAAAQQPGIAPDAAAGGKAATKYKWNAESVFPSRAAWEDEAQKIASDLPGLAAYQGRLGEGPAAAADALNARDDIVRRVYKLYVYASIIHAVDTRDQPAAEMESQASGLFGQALGTVAFMEPELLAVGEATLREWLDRDRRFAVYRQYVENLLRKQEHVRSAEVEELLGMLMDPFSGPATTWNVLTAADLKFPPARAADGSEIPVTDGTLQQILALPDREARRTAWEGYQDTFLQFKNTFASNLATSIKANVFRTRARRFQSTLEAALFENNIPLAVFHNLIDVFRENLPTWHRYWDVRRRALGVDKLYPYDVWAPLKGAKPQIGFEQAIDMISAGLTPMGEEYVSVLRRGALAERWVDVYSTPGKIAGAFSGGSPDTYPFIVTNYDGTIFSLSTLAHELGHSMHSYLTWHNQPFVYSDYAIFVAEVASNFHQAMVRRHLLDSNPDPAFQVSVIEEAMSNFHRYFFIMPTLARWELAMHERAERGLGLSADTMNDVMADLWAEGYGSAMSYDRQRVGMIWANFTHMYMDYYVFQYATGISAANALARRVHEGGPAAAQDYLSFLKAGSSVYPLDALKIAGVDLTSPDPVRQTFAVLGELVDRLEKLVG